MTIATYSAVDRVGTRIIDPLPYAAILWVTTSVVLVAVGAARRRGRPLRRRHGRGPSRRDRRLADADRLPADPVRAVVAPLSGVAPLRESAAVFAAAWGSVKLGEAVDRGDAARRIGASVAIVAGAMLLAVGA